MCPIVTIIIKCKIGKVDVELIIISVAPIGGRCSI